ncbi:hypothetical protein HDK77DRAFT_478713 [Phyllosticta capitalensis]|uniref:uncharacterized protein n=1 Tax=Phyllosticta capitalensis TaxID=121624 RepID=UPI0031311D13
MTAFLASQFVGLPVCITDFSVFERRPRSSNQHGGAPSDDKKSMSSSAQPLSSFVDEKQPRQHTAAKDPVEFRGLLALPTPEKELIEPWNIYFQFPIRLERKQTYQSNGCLDEQD